MQDNTLKKMAQSRSLKLGHFIVEFATPGIGHIMKSAGGEFALFDLEHSGFSFETVKSALRYFEAADVPVIVRVPSKEYVHDLVYRAKAAGREQGFDPIAADTTARFESTAWRRTTATDLRRTFVPAHDLDGTKNAHLGGKTQACSMNSGPSRANTSRSGATHSNPTHARPSGLQVLDQHTLASRATSDSSGRDR